MARYQLIYKNPEADLRKHYPRWVELSLIAALVVTIVLFFSFKRFEHKTALRKVVDGPISITRIPPTVQPPSQPAPRRPQIPVEAEDEDNPEDLIIEEKLFDFQANTALRTPPPAEDPEPIVDFVRLSEKPVLISRVNPVYPELAKRSGIEATVIVNVLLNTRGDVEKAEMLKSHPLFDEAALAAARQFRFTPGRQRLKPVRVWMSIPFRFRLK